MGGDGHYSTERKCAYVVLNWINVTNYFSVVHFKINLLANDWENDADKYRFMAKHCNNQSCSFSEILFCVGLGGGPKTTKVNFCSQLNG